MRKFSGLAQLRTKSLWGVMPLPVHTLKLTKAGDGYRLTTTESRGKSSKRWHIDIAAAEVESQLESLRHATMPAYPVCHPICDGGYTELLIQGEGFQYQYSWLSAMPENFDVLQGFIAWMTKLGLPS